MLSTSTRHGFQNTYPCILGRILCQEECWKCQRLVKVIEYFASSLDYFRLSHWLWGHPSGVLRAFISKSRMLSQLERLHPATNKWEDHIISSDSFVFNSGNNTKNGFNLLATRSSTRPALLYLGGTSSPFWKWGFKVPNMEPEFLPFGSFIRRIINQVLASVLRAEYQFTSPDDGGIGGIRDWNKEEEMLEKDGNGGEFQGMPHRNE